MGGDRWIMNYLWFTIIEVKYVKDKYKQDDRAAAGVVELRVQLFQASLCRPLQYHGWPSPSARHCTYCYSAGGGAGAMVLRCHIKSVNNAMNDFVLWGGCCRYKPHVTFLSDFGVFAVPAWRCPFAQCRTFTNFEKKFSFVSFAFDLFLRFAGYLVVWFIANE